MTYVNSMRLQCTVLCDIFGVATPMVLPLPLLESIHLLAPSGTGTKHEPNESPLLIRSAS